MSRRSLLGAAAAASLPLMTGCGRVAPRASASVAELTSGASFSIAHRGGGGNWPEMTAYAYAQAAAMPRVRALEISVCLSADGVLVCSHDPTTERVTGVAHTIAEVPWTTLSTLAVRAANTSDPAQPARPFTRFEEVFEAYRDRYVLFVEPKTKAAVAPLMALLRARADPARVVWKQWLTSPHFAEAKAHGFSTWAYVLDEPSHRENLVRRAASPDIDMLGAPREQPDAFVRAVSSQARQNGKKTIFWNVRTAADRDRALDLGCQGLMTSNVRDLLQP